MLEIISGVIAFFSAVSFIFHVIGYYYLEISNNYDQTPYLKFDLAILVQYQKPVKESDQFVKRITNLFLSITGYGILGAIFIMAFSLIFS